MKTQTFCQFHLGYDTRLMCPPSKAGALMALIAECTIATDEYVSKSPNVLVIKDDPLNMKLGDFVVYTRAEYNALREAENLAKEADDA